MQKSKTYKQNINRSKLQLKTIFKPEKKENVAEKKPQNVISKKEVFTRIDSNIPKIPDKIPQNNTQINNAQEKNTLIFKIQKYQNSQRFGPFVRHTIHINQSESQLNKLNIVQLNDLLAKICIQLDNRNLDEFYTSMIKGGATMMETVLGPYYNIDGYGDNLIQNKTFMDSLERYKIEHPFPSVSPSIQMSYAIISTFVMTHELNKLSLNTTKKIPNNQTNNITEPLGPPQVSMEPPDVEQMDPELQKEFQNEFLDILKKSLDEEKSESLSTIEEVSDDEQSVKSLVIQDPEDINEENENSVQVGEKL